MLMKTPIYVKFLVVIVLLVVAVQAISHGPIDDRPPPLQPWKSGETTVTISWDGTLTVSGNGAMDDYVPVTEKFTPWRKAVEEGFEPSITAVAIEKGVTYVGAFAFNCFHSYPKSITVAADNAHYTSEDGILFNKNKTKLILYPQSRRQDAYTIPNGVTAIGAGAFVYCQNLTSITIPNSVTSIGTGAFSNCWELKSVTIPNSVTSIGRGAFSSPIGGLTSITIPNGVTYIGKGAFAVCKDLKSITIPNSVTIIEEETFRGCTGLTSIIIPNTVTHIGKNAFLGSGLKSITIPGSVKVIDAGAFEECYYLTSVTIEDGVTTIGAGAFYGCKNLTSVTIPKSVTSIESNTFYSLAYVIVLNPRPPKLGPDAGFHVVYVPARSIFAYRAADGWKELDIRPILTSYEIIALSILSALLLSAVLFAVIKVLQKGKHGITHRRKQEVFR